ncbi:MAG: ribosome small subunit-dependent GTPase A [Acidobacteriota bacterium]
MKKRKRFKKQGGRRRGRGPSSGRRLSKVASELSGGDLESWSESLAPRESISAPGDSPESSPFTLDDENARRGRVTALASGMAWVQEEPDDGPGEGEPLAPGTPADATDAAAVRCQLPSAIAREQKHAVAVGDRVRFAEHGAQHRVLEVLPRDTFLARPDPLNPRHQRVVAANVDLVVHLASVKTPPLRPALIDRYLIAVQLGGAGALLVVNKVDLLRDEERESELACLEGYRDMVPILLCSTVTGEGLEELRARLAGRTSVVVGHSGVGKSSLINALDASIDAAVGAVSKALGVGRHTTTGSNLYSLAGGEIRLIDTPGIREFGLWDLDAPSLPAYFPDFEEHAPACRFRNCTHSHEPRCAVRAAVEAGEIPEARHATYLRILASLGER